MWDLPNLLVLLIIIFSTALTGVIKPTQAFVLVLTCCIPYVLNDVLFPASYMQDQYKYLESVQALRAFKVFPHGYVPTVSEAAIGLALVPLPFVETIQSLGFFNRFLFLAMFIGVVRIFRLNDFFLWLLILFPSLLIYSSLSLREMLILNCMLLSFGLMINRRYWFILFPLYFLYLIKPQNAIIVFFVCIFYWVFKIDKEYLTLKKTGAILALLMSFCISCFGLIYKKLDAIRYAFFAENGTSCFSLNNAGQCNSSYHTIKNVPSLIIELSKGLFSGFLNPLPWNISGLFQLVQVVENVLVLVFVVFLVAKAIKIIPRQTIFWLLFLLLSLNIYGFLVQNTGTLVRYKMPFVICFFIMLGYELQRVKAINNSFSLQQERYEKSANVG